MQKYAFLISYIGTNFCGWQTQKGSAAGKYPSIQKTIEEALTAVTREEAPIVGSGRTDSGVHAVGQVAHFVLKEKIFPPEVLKNGVNSFLPADIRIVECRSVPLDFHAQRSADKKQYSYYFQQGRAPLPHIRDYSWWIKKKLDLRAMREASQFLLGEQDFLPFRAAGAKPGSSVRQVFEVEIIEEPIVFPQVLGLEDGFRFVRLRIIGSGFLKQMVRGIAGTFLQIGENRRDPVCISEIIQKGDRRLVGPTAPARALWLERVWYKDVDFTV